MLTLALVGHASLTLLLLLLPTVPSQASPYGFKNIFILAGQSNMAGRGGVFRDSWDGIVPPQCSPNSSVLRFRAELDWVEAAEPLGADIDVKKTCGVGPGMAFANAIREWDSGFGTVGLVPCAVGGTSIDQWQRGTRLYAELKRRAESSLRDGGAIRAMLWYQGESDTVKRKDAESYGAKLQGFIRHLRADLNASTLPVVLVLVASGEGSLVETVRTAQVRVGKEVPNVSYVDAKGLALDPDGLHLNTQAQVQLGQMLAHSFLQTLPPPTTTTTTTQPQRHIHPSPLHGTTSAAGLSSISGSTFCAPPPWRWRLSHTIALASVWLLVMVHFDATLARPVLEP